MVSPANKENMDTNEREKQLDRAFAKRIRLVAENSRGQLSSTWMFWGNRNDYYFGSKGLLGKFKISLHENGVGYLAFDKPFYLQKKAAGADVPSKTLFEWKYPMPNDLGAVHVASLFLPSEHYRCPPLSERDDQKTAVLGVPDGRAAEVRLFISNESPDTLEDKLLKVGIPMFVTDLENGLFVSIVARPSLFDPSVLPTQEKLNLGKKVFFEEPEADSDNYNAMFWNKPGDSGTLTVIEIGGVGLKRN